MQPYPVQILDLTLMQLTNWRWSWRGVVVAGTVVPLFSTFAFGAFASDGGASALGFVLTGNLVVSLLFSTMGSVSGNFAFMRAVGRFDYFATLPIRRSALILATVLAFLALSLPPLVVTALLSARLLHVPLRVSPWVIAVVPLIAMSLSGLGALIGITARNPEESNSLTLLATFLLAGIGPVLIPPERLPEPFRIAGWFSPSTYAASALRRTVLGRTDGIPLALDAAVLLALSLFLLWTVGRKMDWRRSP